ncbi:hypothetical protein D3C80_1703720 [compost metagenome]
MPGAAVATKASRYARDNHAAVIAQSIWVHLFYARCEEHGAASSGQRLLICRRRSRVALEIFLGTELQRIYEEAGDDEFTFLSGHLQ